MAVLSKPTFPLMKLPAELRLQILGYWLLSPTPIVDLQKGVVYTAVLQVCKQLYAEGHPLLAKNIFRFTSAKAMVSLLLPLPRPCIQYIELDHMHIHALNSLDEQTYEQLGQGDLATILTVPGRPSEIGLYETIDNTPYEQLVQDQQAAQQIFQPSKISYMHHAPHDFHENVLQTMGIKGSNIKGFTLDVGPNLTNWLFVKPALPGRVGVLIKGLVFSTLHAAILIGSHILLASRSLLDSRNLVDYLQEVNPVIIRGKDVEILQPLWDALVHGDTAPVEVASVAAQLMLLPACWRINESCCPPRGSVIFKS